MNKKWNFVNKGDKSAEVFIYEDIGEGWFGGLTAMDFIKELDALGDIDQLSVRINSIGGSVFEAVAIYNAIARHKAEVTVHVDGIAASAASFIATAADPGKLFIADNARMMIHNAWTIEMGDKNQMRKTADRLEAVDGLIVDTYANRGKADRAEIVRQMDAETWFTAQEAVDAGLADEVEDQLEAAALAVGKFDMSRFKHPPKDVPSAPPAGKVAEVKKSRDASEEIAVRMRLLDIANQPG